MTSTLHAPELPDVGDDVLRQCETMMAFGILLRRSGILARDTGSKSPVSFAGMEGSTLVDVEVAHGWSRIRVAYDGEVVLVATGADYADARRRAIEKARAIKPTLARIGGSAT